MNMSLLNDILTAYGASGHEENVRKVIAKALFGHVDALETDAMGNLIAVRRGDGTGRRVMLCAHMDHIGLIAVDADKDGYVRVSNVGGIDPANLISMHVVFGNGVEGVVDAEPVEGKLKVCDLFVDIGAASREEALSRVSIGDVCVMKPRVSRLGEHRLASPAMDDRIACYVLTELMLSLPENIKNDVAAVFTVQEELGVRGATTAAYAIDPDLGIALDVTATGDTPGVKGHLPMKLGAGAAVKIMDAGMIATPWVVQMMLDAAQENGIPVQREILPFGGTDAGAIQSTKGGIPSGAISIPCRYVHSAAETVDVRDVRAALDLALACVMK